MSSKSVNSKDLLSEEASSNSQEVALQWPIPVLRENEHYYLDNGFMVFTELYHRSRGTCCGNACRHCPYEHINVRKKKPIL